MKRRTRFGFPGYTAAIMVVLLVGVAAVWLMTFQPASGLILLLAVGVALAGLGHRWYRHVRRQRRRAASETRLQI
jgi:membrane protein implicated in regulation of membrane protease activity